MTKEQFIESCLHDYRTGKSQSLPRKAMAIEELRNNRIPMPNVEFIVSMYPKYRALLLKADAKETSLWMFLDVDAFDEEAVKNTAEQFYDFVSKVGEVN